jgi:hypothetical protein
MGSGIVTSPLMNPAMWEDPRDLLAMQLINGRLLMVLGAGVSFGFGLPAWNELISRAAANTGCALASDISAEDAADVVLHSGCSGDDIRFAEEIRKALYQTYDRSINTLVTNRLLSAVGALAMASIRGRVSRIVSFNFDDLVERFVAYHGFVERSVAVMPSWAAIADVHVYHQHGLLSSDPAAVATSPIVFAQSHFDRVVGKPALWRNFLVESFCSHTCLFLGLSGRDNNLKSVLTETKDNHVGMLDGDPLWGVRVSDNAADSMRTMWESRGVKHVALPSYDHLPEWLLSIAQRAATRARPGTA